MATNYPGSLDTSTQQPSPSASTEMDDSGFEHDAVHTNHSGAIIALETKVGTGNSNAVADSVLAGTGSGTSGWTTTPTLVKLTVADTGEALRMERSGYDSYGFQHSAGSGIEFRNFTDGVTEMYFNGAGSVGIGTNAPVAGLHIEGFGDASLSSTGHYIQLGATSGDNLRLDNNEIIAANNGSADTLYLQNDGGTIAIGNNTAAKVGIGTNSPETSLSIVAANALGSTFTGSVDGEGLRVQSNYTAGNYTSLVEGSYTDTSNFPHTRIGAMYDGGGSNLAFGTSNNYSTGITNTAMFIDSDGKVGIGTTSPGQQFHVNSGNTNTTSVFESDDGTAYIGIKDNSSGSNIHVAIGAIGNEMRLRANNGNRIRLTGTYMSPGTDNTTDLGTSSLRFDDVYATNGTIQTSDQRDKKDITDLDLGLDFVNALRPVSFVWDDRSGYVGSREHMGFIAQEVAGTLGDQASDRAVWINAPAGQISDDEGGVIDTPDRQGIRYEELIAPLVKAVQQLSARVTALEAA